MTKPWEPKILGVKDGLTQATVAKEGFRERKNFEEFLNIFAGHSHIDSNAALSSSLILECVKLKGDAKLTDFLWFSPMSYCAVSQSTFEILSNHNLFRHKFYAAHVLDAAGRQVLGYRFFYTDFYDESIIDFKGSEFTTGNKFDGFKPVSVNSISDLNSLKTFYQVKRLRLKDIDENLDLFKTKLSLETIVSERLHKTLVNAKVTGINFSEIDIEISN